MIGFLLLLEGGSCPVLIFLKLSPHASALWPYERQVERCRRHLSLESSLGCTPLKIGVVFDEMKFDFDSFILSSVFIF